MKHTTIRRQIALLIFVVVGLFYITSMAFSIYEIKALSRQIEAESHRMIDRYENGFGNEDEAGREAPERNRKNREELSDAIDKRINASVRNIMVKMSASGVLALIVAIFVSGYVAGRIVHPIERLGSQMQEVGQGNLDREVVVDGPEEVEELARHFNLMTAALKEHMEQLTLTTSEKERMTAELVLMRKIQADMIPDRYPTRSEMLLFADAWELSGSGGSYYDFFMVDDDRLAIIVGDVSEQGVMATLFAVMSQTFLQSFCKMGYAPSRALAETNNQLSERNAMGLNVAVTVLLVDLSSGEVQYASAGGEPLIVRTAGENARTLDGEVTIPLGNMENVVYRPHRLMLRQGDGLTIYTRGTVLAQNEAGEWYGHERLAAMIDRKVGYELPLIIDDVHADMSAFMGDKRQESDSLIVLFRYLG